MTVWRLTSIGLALLLPLTVSAEIVRVGGDRDYPPYEFVDEQGLADGFHIDLVRSLGIYDQSVGYDALADLNTGVPTVIVDMSGSGDLLAQLQAELGDQLRYCINVGLTHWDEFKPAAGIPKERAEFFFAPSHIQKRMKDWGPEGFASRTASFLSDTARKSRQWLKLREIHGLEGLAEVYPDVCQGRIPPDEGLIVRLSLND